MSIRWRISVSVFVFLVTISFPIQAMETITREDIGAWIDEYRDAIPEFSPGTTITQTDLEKIRPFVSPAHMNELDFPEISMAIMPTGDYSPHEVYENATSQYADQAKLGEDGQLNGYVAGSPFTIKEIRESSPEETGLMIGWNFYFRWQHYGHAAFRSILFFLEEGKDQGGMSEQPYNIFHGGGKVVRSVESHWQRSYFNHLAQLPDSNFRFDLPEMKNAMWKDTVEYTAPFEFRGQRMMIERSLDPNENDTLNAYLPKQRKIRRLSAKERTDSWAGTELNFDDFYGFDGRVLDYHWRSLGTKKILAVMNSKYEYARYYGPHSRVPEDQWELRDCLVVEQFSKFDYHPHGSKVLFLDRDHYNVVLVLIFDRNGDLWKIFTPLYSWSEDTLDRPDLNRGVRIAMYKSITITNLRTGDTNLLNIIESGYPVRTARKVRKLYQLDRLNEGR